MRHSWLTLLFLFICSSLSFAQETAKGKYDELAQKVEKTIKEKDKIQIEALTVLNDGGTIHLEGLADLFGSRFLAGEISGKTEGVIKVENEIAVRISEVSDLDIESQLFDKIQKHLRGDPFDLVSVRVSHGFVTLSGNVRDTTLQDDTFKEAIWIRGVRDVKNEIVLASISAGDERLRQAIYRRLSRDYAQYFLGRLPSVVILVEGGRVTLVGNVQSAVDQQKIGNTVRSLPGVLSVNNQLQLN